MEAWELDLTSNRGQAGLEPRKLGHRTISRWLLARNYDGALWPLTSSEMFLTPGMCGVCVFLNFFFYYYYFCRNEKRADFSVLGDSGLSKASKHLGEVYFGLWVSGQGGVGRGTVLRGHWTHYYHSHWSTLPALPPTHPHSSTLEVPSSWPLPQGKQDVFSRLSQVSGGSRWEEAV